MVRKRGVDPSGGVGWGVGRMGRGSEEWVGGHGCAGTGSGVPAWAEGAARRSGGVAGPADGQLDGGGGAPPEQ